MSDQFLDIDQYEKKEKIGHGSFGEVFKVKHKKTNQMYAAKISFITMDTNLSKDFHNILREVNINCKMIHPSVLQFIGYSPVNFNHESKPVIITEYLKNGSLSRILDLERRALSLPQWNDTTKLITIFGIAAGMSYLHSHNILHRDLKPANILMNDSLMPKIADFGYSKQIHSNKETMSIQSTLEVKGTPVYISPEIYINNTYTKSSDVYAFGFIMYEIITNEEPFKDLSCFRIYDEVINGRRPSFNYPITSAYRDLIERCWAQDMNERPTFDSILDELKNNPDFLIESIEKDDFLEYIEYIETAKIEFDSNYQIIKIKDYVPKSKSRIFQKVDINKYFGSVKSFISSHVFGWFSRQNSIISSEQFNSLNDECKQLVKEAENNSQKQFLVGSNFIEGKENFPQIFDLGIKYLERSISLGSIDSALYLGKIYTENKFAPRDYEKAKKYLSKFWKSNDASARVFYTKILKKQNKLKDAKYYFEQETKKGNAESMYEYAKMLFLGKGCQTNEEEATNLFVLSKSKGFSKSDNYIAALSKIKKHKLFNELQQETKHFLVKQIIQNKSTTKKIEMNFKQAQVLFNNNSFNSTDFIDVLGLFETISIQIDYLSENFNKILNQVSQLKEDFYPNVIININVLDFQKIECLFGHNKYINSMNFKSPIQIIPTKFLYKCSSLTLITIPSSVTKIEENAFNGCSSLSEVMFEEPFSITEIQNYSFKNCELLREIKIPSSVVFIGNGAFQNCISLSEITVTSPVIEIKSFAFKKCTSLVNVTLPSSITRISEGMFKKCTSLKNINIPSSVIKIENSAFKDCTSIRQVKIPSFVTKIEGMAFCGCSLLDEIIIPPNVTYIGFAAFKDCSALNEIVIPESVASIGENTFNGCKSLAKVSIPSTVTFIGYFSFRDCISLTEISIPSKVKSIGEGAFYSCTSLKRINIPSNVKEIRKSVFENCYSLQEISIPDSLTFIGENAFKNCSSLENIPINFVKSDEDLSNYGFDVTLI